LIVAWVSGTVAPATLTTVVTLAFFPSLCGVFQAPSTAKASRSARHPSKKILMKISNTKFSNEEVVLDFHEYNACEFTNCRFVVLGYGAFALNQCEVTNCEFTFAGPAASVIQTMATIYHSLGDQGKNLIEGTFEQIRNASGKAPA